MRSKIRAALIFVAIAFTSMTTDAQEKQNLEDLTFSAMLRSVDLSEEPKASALIRKFQDLEARQKLMNGPLSPKNSGFII